MGLQKIRLDSFFKFLRELTIIFISIVLAFLFEDYRENRNQLKEYRERLINFQRELINIIDGKSHLDSLKVVSDGQNRGREFERLLNIIWLDSLVTIQQASLGDFQFILESQKLTADLYGGYGPSPLSQEIRIKFADHILNKRLLEGLDNYEEEMINLQRLQQTMLESHDLLNRLLEKTNPYHKFTRQDSLLFYSNEFIWRLKEIVSYRKSEYAYKKLLYQRRFLRILNEVNQELRLHDINGQEMICPTIDDFYKRFECENGRPIDERDSLRTIKELVIIERNEFRMARAAPNN